MLALLCSPCKMVDEHPRDDQEGKKVTDKSVLKEKRRGGKRRHACSRKSRKTKRTTDACTGKEKKQTVHVFICYCLSRPSARETFRCIDPQRSRVHSSKRAHAQNKGRRKDHATAATKEERKSKHRAHTRRRNENTHTQKPFTRF